jgi:hypothetical protein
LKSGRGGVAGTGPKQREEPDFRDGGLADATGASAVTGFTGGVDMIFLFYLKQ